MIAFDSYSYSQKDNENRVKGILQHADFKHNLREILSFILGIIDLTSLEGSDNKSKILAFGKKASGFDVFGQEKIYPAAVCVYTPFVRLLKKALADTPVNIASVAGYFPSGQASLHIKTEEVKYAIDQGADEIDMVINRGKVLEGNINCVFEEIVAVKNICQKVHLKVILETGELESIENIRKASEIAINAGADFIKTSTGKIQPAATKEATLVMMDTISEYFQKTGKKVGIKPAGGISDPETALQYFYLVKEILGKEWLHKDYFRIGASSLADQILKELL